jgi:photosystem II stability/assembly factor-like uncharacterized protein
MKYMYLFFRKSHMISLPTALCLVQIIVLCWGCKTEFESSSQQRPYEEIHDLEIDPNNGNIIYAATGVGLYKSTIGGGSWKEILDDHINALAINHIYPDILYALGGTLFKSENAGDSWQPIEIPFEGEVLKLSPLVNRTLYAGNGSGLYKSKDGGASWTRISSQHFIDISIDHTNQGILYLIRDEVLYKSIDEGITWMRVMTGIRGSVQVIELGPHNSETLYCGTTSGLFKSSDGAENWVETQLNGSITSIAVHTGNSNLLYISKPNKLFKSNDGGINWYEVAIVPPLTHPTFEISSVKTDPFNSNIIFIVLTGDPWSTERGVLKSEDGGETWESKSSGLPRVPEPDGWNL